MYTRRLNTLPRPPASAPPPHPAPVGGHDLRTRPKNAAFGLTPVCNAPTGAVWASKCGESRVKLWELEISGV